MVREKRLNTGKPVLDMQHVLLHQQREMQLMRAEVRNVTGLLNELMQRQDVSVSAKVRDCVRTIGNEGTVFLDLPLGTAVAMVVPNFVRKVLSPEPLSSSQFLHKTKCCQFGRNVDRGGLKCVPGVDFTTKKGVQDWTIFELKCQSGAPAGVPDCPLRVR